MFYYLHHLTEWFSPLRIFQYITLRAFLGAATAFLIVLVLGPWVVRWLRALNFGEQSREMDVDQLKEFFRS